MSKQTISDLLFILQILCTVIAGGGQILRMLATMQGVNVTWFLLWELFLVLNLILSLRAHKAQPSRVTKQTLLTYMTWTMIITACIAVMFARGRYAWDIVDSTTMIVCLLGNVVISFWAARRHREPSDPLVMGWMAVFCLAVPQLFLALKIGLEGGTGLWGGNVLLGHVTAWTRVGQLCFSLREATWDRNRVGSLLSEAANAVSWTIVTIVWLLH